MTSVPYNALYKLPHLALAAFRAYLALSTGTTSCGPAIDEISISTFSVAILKSFPSSTKYPIDFKKAIYLILSNSFPLFDICQLSIFF